MSARKQYRKLGRIGNSFGVSLPKEMIERIKAKQGDLLEVTYENDAILIRPAEQFPIDEDDLSPEMVKALDNTFKKYDHLFKELKNL